MCSYTSYGSIPIHLNRSSVKPNSSICIGLSLSSTKIVIEKFASTLTSVSPVTLSKGMTDDWPEDVPATEAEIAVFEAWFGELFDELFGDG
jgi:hypothetical protein